MLWRWQQLEDGDHFSHWIVVSGSLGGTWWYVLQAACSWIQLTLSIAELIVNILTAPGYIASCMHSYR